MADEKVLTALVYCLMSACETPRSKSAVHEVSAPFGSPVPYTHLRANEPDSNLVCRLLLEKKKTPQKKA